jgi:hypothetical protein
MAKRREERPKAGQRRAAQNPPAEAEGTERGLLEGGFDPGLADLGDDVARGAGDGGSPRLPSRGKLEGGIDAGLTDLGDDVARGAEDGGSPRLPSRGKLEGGIDAGLTDLGDDGDRPVDLDDEDWPR